MRSTFSPTQGLHWLFFDLNSYFASVEQQESPELIGKPVAVVPMMTDSTCAIAASYEAKRYGIKTGTKIYDAKKMCPKLICVLARHDVYVDYHHRILDELENHLPVTTVCSIDEAACRLIGREQQQQNAIAIAHNIKQGLRDNIGDAIRCSIGIAPNAFLAKVATDMQKPDGLTILEPDNYQHKLFKLKLNDLTGIGHNMERRLNHAGIYSIEQFWNISPKHARKIWGSVGGEKFWYKLHGYEVPDKETQKRVVGHSRVLEPSLRAPDKAFNITKQLALKAATRLRRYDLYARRFALQVKGSTQGWGREISFSPTRDNFMFVKTLSQLWDQMLWETKAQSLRKVSISIHDLYKPEEVTLDLFAETDNNSTKNPTLSNAMDTINKRYGINTVNIGTVSKTTAGHVGTKIAFNRIPEKVEFEE